MGSFLQFKRLTSGTVTETFRVDGTATDLDSGNPVVTLTRPDGTAGPAAGTISHPSTGTYSFVLAGQPELTIFDYAFVGTVGGQPQTLAGKIEIVGADIFTISDLRALRVAGSTPFSTSATPLISNQQIMDARAATLDEFEQILDYSPVPRFAREPVDGNGLWSVLLPHHKTHRLISVTVNGVAQTVGSYTLRRSGVLEATSNYVASGTFTAGRQNVVVEYVHGWERVEGDGRDMAMMRAAMKLQPGQSSTATTYVTPDGGVYSYDRAGSRNAAGEKVYFGVGAIADWLNEHRQVAAAIA